jgi:hypothetical protein
MRKPLGLGETELASPQLLYALLGREVKILGTHFVSFQGAIRIQTLAHMICLSKRYTKTYQNRHIAVGKNYLVVSSSRHTDEREDKNNSRSKFSDYRNDYLRNVAKKSTDFWNRKKAAACGNQVD